MVEGRSKLRRFQFSLRAVLVLLTLVAVAGWWWQKRFRVTSTTTRTSPTSQGIKKVELHKMETKRRQGLHIVLDGPTTVVDGEGKMISEELWRSGVRHGIYRRWDDAGALLFECEFRRGRLVRVGDTAVVDFLPTDVTSETPTGSRVLRTLREDTVFDYLNQPLSAVTEDIEFVHNIPVLMDSREITAAGIDMHVPITATIRGVPLYMALAELLTPLKLTCACRYDVLWITTPDSALHDDDLAPRVVFDHASPKMLQALRDATSFDYLEQPLETVFRDQAFNHNIDIECELRDAAAPVTLDVRFDSLASAVGVLLYLFDLQCEAQGDTLIVTNADPTTQKTSASSDSSLKNDQSRRN